MVVNGTLMLCWISGSVGIVVADSSVRGMARLKLGRQQSCTCTFYCEWAVFRRYTWQLKGEFEKALMDYTASTNDRPGQRLTK